MILSRRRRGAAAKGWEPPRVCRRLHLQVGTSTAGPPISANYRTVELWTNRAARAAGGGNSRPTVFPSGVIVSDTEFPQSEFYYDFCRALGLRYVVGTVMELTDGGAMPLDLHRPEGAGPFEREDAARLQLVLPHLRRAMGLRGRLAAPPQETPARRRSTRSGRR